jgi:hypothetical protein
VDDLALPHAVVPADLVRTKKISPLELGEAAGACTERLNPRLNAAATPMYDLAGAGAAGPLPEELFTFVRQPPV